MARYVYFDPEKNKDIKKSLGKEYKLTIFQLKRYKYYFYISVLINIALLALLIKYYC